MKGNLSPFLTVMEGKGRPTNSPTHSGKSNPKMIEDDVEMDKIVVEDLVKPLAFVLKYFLPFLDSIMYDPVAKCCIVRKGSFWRKAFCVCWQCMVLYRLGINLVPDSNTEPASLNSASRADNGISSIGKGAYFVFITFQLLNIYLFCTKTRTICNLLNCVLDLSPKLNIKDRCPPRIKLVRYYANFAWIFVTLYASITFILYLVQVFPNSKPSHVTSINNTTTRKSGKYKLDFTGVQEAHEIKIVEFITAVANLLNIFCWMMIFFHLAIWASVFRQLFMLLYWRLQTKNKMGEYIIIPNEIRTFNKITSILDTFNRIYGLLNLLGAVVVITYISLSIKHVFCRLDNILNMGMGFPLLLSYVPMGSSSIMIAEVQRVVRQDSTASSFAGTIKDEYGKFTKECGDPAESLCGIAIVHYDLSTSNIGFKGLGFFTVSYQFISTIMSVIMSYSILLSQMFPHENEEIDV